MQGVLGTMSQKLRRRLRKKFKVSSEEKSLSERKVRRRPLGSI